MAKADLISKATVCGSGKNELRTIWAIGSNNDRDIAGVSLVPSGQNEETTESCDPEFAANISQMNSFGVPQSYPNSGVVGVGLPFVI